LFQLKNEKAQDGKKKVVDDVRKYVIRRTIDRSAKGKKNLTKAPKIQRLVTSVRLQRKRAEKATKIARGKDTKEQLAQYAKLKALRAKESKEARREKSSRRRSTGRNSTNQ